jgi:hypothetical protein
MNKWKAAVVLGMVFMLAACVTINVYFPAAAAERAAEQFVEDVLAEPEKDSSLFLPWEDVGRSARLAAHGTIDFLISSAEAQQPEIEINTPQINAIKARMAERQRTVLAAWFDAGDENRDRKAVYREIAVANGHPEWEQDIQQTFAKEWVRNARSGWYYQEANGSWRQK